MVGVLWQGKGGYKNINDHALTRIEPAMPVFSCPKTTCALNKMSNSSLHTWICFENIALLNEYKVNKDTYTQQKNVYLGCLGPNMFQINNISEL
jgi:hypothetical protein